MMLGSGVRLIVRATVMTVRGLAGHAVSRRAGGRSRPHRHGLLGLHGLEGGTGVPCLRHRLGVPGAAVHLDLSRSPRIRPVRVPVTTEEAGGGGFAHRLLTPTATGGAGRCRAVRGTTTPHAGPGRLADGHGTCRPTAAQHNASPRRRAARWRGDHQGHRSLVRADGEGAELLRPLHRDKALERPEPQHVPPGSVERPAGCGVTTRHHQSGRALETTRGVLRGW
ncbi:hypothetical protein QJS66_10460 [Kocuria rhizophila]|nr:hypothetical protein QJS66_10460 [Kocuria rhizophila]